MAREFAFFCLESSYGTPMVPTLAEMWTTSGSGTVGAGVAGFVGFYARLDGSNSFSMRPRPAIVAVPYGGGVAIDAFRVADKLAVEGTFKTKLYAGPWSQFLLQWGAQQINTGGYVGGSGVSTGWAYSSATGDLPSVTIVHAIQRSDGTYKVRQYGGVKVKSWNFTLSEESTVADITMNLVGSSVAGNQWSLGNYVDPTLQTAASPATAPTWGSTSTASTVCPPATANLPTVPYLFINATPVTIGISRTTFQSISLSCENMIAMRYWNNRFVQLAKFVGRKVTLEAINWYTNMSPEDRVEYEGLVAQTVSVELNNSTHTIIWTMNTNNIVTALEDELPLSDIYTQKLTATSQIDPTYSVTDYALAPDFQMAFT